MSHKNTIFLIMVGIGIISIVFFVLGLFGLSKEERINKSSRFYTSVYFLIIGIISATAFVPYIFYRFNLMKSINEISYFMFSILLCMFSMFVSGIYALLNEDKINNSMLVGIAKRKLIFSIFFIGIAGYYWVKRHGFN